MSDVHGKARLLLANADHTASRSVRDPRRMPDLILEHGHLRTMMRELIEFHEGFAQEHKTLVRMVSELVGSVTASSNGQLKWATEIPPGTAPVFRRKLNELIRYLRDSSR